MIIALACTTVYIMVVINTLRIVQFLKKCITSEFFSVQISLQIMQLMYAVQIVLFFLITDKFPKTIQIAFFFFNYIELFDFNSSIQLKR